MADGSSSLPPRRLASLADDDDGDLEEGQFVPAAYHSSSDTDDDAPTPPLQRARRPGRLSLKDVLALGRSDALPSPAPSSESEGTISDDDGNPSPASVFRMMEPTKRKRAAVALDGGWAATGKRGWAGGKLAVVAAAPNLNNNPQSTSHSNASADSSSSSAQAVVVHLQQTPPAPPLPFAEQAQPVHLHHQPVAAQLPHELVVIPQRAAAADQPPRRVYTCKECGRTFPTNQALGGHAAGHRSRQREAEAAAAAAGMTQELGEDGAAAFLAALRRARREEAPHECRKCHKVFATGVALGGHMRVHYTGPPIVPARRNKKRCLAPALQPVEDMAAAAVPPPDLSLALSIKTEEATSSTVPAGGVRAVRLFGIDISPQVQLAPSEQQCPGTTTGDYSSAAGGQQ